MVGENQDGSGPSDIGSDPYGRDVTSREQQQLPVLNASQIIGIGHSEDNSGVRRRGAADASNADPEALLRERHSRNPRELFQGRPSTDVGNHLISRGLGSGASIQQSDRGVGTERTSGEAEPMAGEEGGPPGHGLADLPRSRVAQRRTPSLEELAADIQSSIELVRRRCQRRYGLSPWDEWRLDDPEEVPARAGQVARVDGGAASRQRRDVVAQRLTGELRLSGAADAGARYMGGSQFASVSGDLADLAARLDSGAGEAAIGAAADEFQLAGAERATDPDFGRGGGLAVSSASLLAASGSRGDGDMLGFVGFGDSRLHLLGRNPREPLSSSGAAAEDHGIPSVALQAPSATGDAADDAAAGPAEGAAGGGGESERTEAVLGSGSKRRRFLPGPDAVDLLECPICCEVMQPPIFQCCNGHVLCHDCLPRVGTSCPSCRQPTGHIRNLALEKFAASSLISCAHAGCPDMLLPNQLDAHEGSCPFGPLPCVLGGCAFQGGEEALLQHLEQRHHAAVASICWGLRTGMSDPVLVTPGQRVCLMWVGQGIGVSSLRCEGALVVREQVGDRECHLYGLLIRRAGRTGDPSLSCVRCTLHVAMLASELACSAGWTLGGPGVWLQDARAGGAQPASLSLSGTEAARSLWVQLELAES